MKHETIKLGLLENSHAFLKEAVRNAIEADRDPRRWQFAILHLVQANELGLKAALEKYHPVLIYDDIDSAKSVTVNPRVAIKRLSDPRIGGLRFSARDIERVNEAIALRNEVTHQHFELNPQFGAAKFFALLPFVWRFQEQHLKTNIRKVLSTGELEALRSVEKAVNALVEAAIERITEEKIDPKRVWACPACEHTTFVANKGFGACYACRHRERLSKCDKCGKAFPKRVLEHLVPREWIQESPSVIEALLDHGGYRYLDAAVCSECLKTVFENDAVEQAVGLAMATHAIEQEYGRVHEDEGEW